MPVISRLRKTRTVSAVSAECRSPGHRQRRGRTFVVRDHIILDQPRRLTWPFQADEAHGLTLDGLTARIGREPAISIVPEGLDAPLEVEVRRTDQVYGYAGPCPVLHHFRYDCRQAVPAICIDWQIRWE